MRYIEIEIKSDESGDEYIVPVSELEDWSDLYDKGLLEDNWQPFSDKYGKYRVGGAVSNYQLFIPEEELARLTFHK
jgi:hypothetical protein